jgi:tetratricopeptide (TPR) repeat protein
MAGKLSEAETYYLRILEQDPAEISSLFSMAGISQRKGNFVKAKEYYKQILASDSTNFSVYKQLSDMIESSEGLVYATAYLQKANRHLLDTLDNVNTYQGLLKSKRHLKHLNDTEIRNLQQDLFTHKNELARVVKHVSSFRIEGVSRLAGDFNRTDFVKTAAKIRDSRLSLPASTTLR